MILKYIFLEIINNKKRSLIVAILAFTFVFFLSFGFFLKSFNNNIYEAYAHDEGYCIDINVIDNLCYGNWKEVIDIINNLPYIEGFNNSRQIGVECTLSNIKNQQDIYLFGNVNTKFSDFFRIGNFELISGEMPVCGKYQIIIDNDFSMKNQIQIGDIVSIGVEDKDLELSVVGIYEIKKMPEVDIDNDGFYKECEKNIVLCDYLSYEFLAEDTDFTLMSVYVDELCNMDSVYKALKEKLNENALVIDTIKNHVSSTGTTINSINKLSNVMLFFSVALFLICMFVITAIWINDHASMIFIYKALGEKNDKILSKLILEIVIICVPVCTAAGIIIRWILRRFAEEIFEFMLSISKNSINSWDSVNLDCLFLISLKEYIIISFLVAIIIIVWVFICGCFMVNRRCIELNK